MPRRRRALVSPVTDQVATSKPDLDDQRIATGASADFSPAEWTVGCFVRPVSRDANGTIARAFINATGGWVFRFSDDDEVFALVSLQGGGNQVVTITAPATLFDGEWHFVLARQDGSTIDVTVDDEAFASAGMAFAASLNAGLGPTLFEHESGDAGHSLEGDIADFRFYNVKLTDREVKEWRQSGGATLQRESGLVARPTVVERTGAVLMTDAANAARVWTEAGAGTALTVVASASETRAV